MRASSIGTSAEGRDIWMLTVGRDPDRARPAVWLDGNMHAMELAGSAAALVAAEEAARVVEGEPTTRPLSTTAAAVAKEALYCIVPRVAVDGAEHVLATGRYVRSRPHDARALRTRPWLRLCDVDGDGLALWMRRRDPAGDFVESKEMAGVMVPRTIDDDGPYYKLCPEGVIEGWDGAHAPAWEFLDDGPDDFNRNFPWSWAPVEDQAGAGDYPGSAPEVRAILDVTARMPHLFSWLNLHTFGGVAIRPLGHAVDAQMDPGDLPVFRQLEAFTEEQLGYPTVSGFEEFCYQPNRPLRGDVVDYAYHQRGCLAVAIELWDLFAQAGIAKKKPFVDHYTKLTRADLVAIASLDARGNARRSYPAWRPCKHPQLGDVEVGRFDGRVGVWNPPLDRLGAICDGVAALLLRTAALMPRMALAATTTRTGGATRLDVVASNTGYLATHGMPSHRKLHLAEPIVVEAQGVGGARVASTARVEIGHLDGWGRGLYGAGHNPPYQMSTADRTERRVSFLVEGGGTVRLAASSPRTGRVEIVVDV